MTDDVSFFNPVNLKTAVDIGKTLVSLVRQAESKGLDVHYAAELNGKIADMQFALIDAQSDALASQEAQSKQSAKIKELEQTIAEFENWEAEKARYKLVHIKKMAVRLHTCFAKNLHRKASHYTTSARIAIITGQKLFFSVSSGADG